MYMLPGAVYMLPVLIICKRKVARTKCGLYLLREFPSCLLDMSLSPYKDSLTKKIPPQELVTKTQVHENSFW